MRRILLAAIATLALTSQASAQGWTGFYLGGHGGYGWGDSSSGSSDTVFSFGSGRISTDTDGGFAGVTLGYNAQVENFVIGLEFDYSWASIDGRGVVGSNVLSADFDGFGSATVRLGYSFGPALLYAKGGLGFAEVRNFATDNADPLDTTSVKDTVTGFTIGGGVEYKFAQAWTFKAEYQYFDLENQRSTNSDTDDYVHRNDLHVVKFGINYVFGH